MNRVEHVIHAGHSYRSFECHACGHQWRVLETGEHVPTTGGDGEGDRLDRSRMSQLPSPAKRHTPKSSRATRTPKRK